MACVGFWFAHEIVGFIIPDLEKKIVILSMNLTLRVAIAMRNRVRGSLATLPLSPSQPTVVIAGRRRAKTASRIPGRRRRRPGCHMCDCQNRIVIFRDIMTHPRAVTRHPESPAPGRRVTSHHNDIISHGDHRFTGIGLPGAKPGGHWQVGSSQVITVLSCVRVNDGIGQPRSGQPEPLAAGRH